MIGRWCLCVCLVWVSRSVGCIADCCYLDFEKEYFCSCFVCKMDVEVGYWSMVGFGMVVLVQTWVVDYSYCYWVLARNLVVRNFFADCCSKVYKLVVVCCIVLVFCCLGNILKIEM